ncbi:MAG: M3 family oligoendopeptidase [Candidatus Zixiibacteriota bacterium]
MTGHTETFTEAAPRWELDSLFPGGSASPQFRAFLAEIQSGLDEAGKTRAALPRSLDPTARHAWSGWILALQELAEKIELAQVYALCLTSQNVDDSGALGLTSATNELKSRWQILEAALESFALKQPDAEWETFVTGDTLRPVRYYLDEVRRNARMRMPEEQEKLALELAVNGYHAWNMLYEKMGGDLRVPVEEGGRTKLISLGQNSARFSNPDRAVRRDAFDKLEKAWESRAELASLALNAQAGFRLSVYAHRGWDSPLTEPLILNRLTQDSLDAMWDGIARGREPLLRYVAAKKRLLGLDRFCWYDQEAPVGRVDRTYTFNEAGEFVASHLGSFSEEMGDFTRMALANRWVEAENRPGKRGGAWCSRVPIRRQERIFMTFSGTYDSVSTLAHEFGHAYHGFVLKQEPAFAQHYPMTLAETASIFNELRVTDAALSEAGDPAEKLALIDQKLQAAFVFFCNIRARFLFDIRFYTERKKGMVEMQQLCEIMRNAQREAFFGCLDEGEGLHPLFWASKLHFFVTEFPFYNFPYTFGFLFARGVYARARAEGAAFAPKYRALLSDSGRMSTEDVAQKHLGVDLRRPEFWTSAVNSALADVPEFERLAGAS